MVVVVVVVLVVVALDVVVQPITLCNTGTMIRTRRRGGSGRGSGGRRGAAAARQLVLRDVGCVVLAEQVVGVVVQPAAGRLAAAGVPVDGHAELLVEARHLARAELGQRDVVRPADRVHAGERDPLTALARRRHRRRCNQPHNQNERLQYLWPGTASLPGRRRHADPRTRGRQTDRRTDGERAPLAALTRRRHRRSCNQQHNQNQLLQYW